MPAPTPKTPQPADIPWLHGQIVAAVAMALPFRIVEGDPVQGYTVLEADNTGRRIVVTVAEV